VVVIAVVAVLVLVVGAIAVFAFRRGGGDEVHSVEGYRQALDTLREVGSKGASPTVRVIGREADPVQDPPGGPPGSRSVSMPGSLATERESAAFGSGPEETGVGLDDGAGGMPVFGEREPTGASTGRSIARESRQTRRAISAMNHRPRRMGASLVAAAIVVAAVAVLVLVVRDHRKPAAGHHDSPTTTTTAHTTNTTTASTVAHQASGAHHSATHKSGAHQSAPHNPNNYAPVSATPGAATYAPPATSYSLVVDAGAGDCWLQITQVATGASVYANTLTQGQSESVTLTGASTVVLGSPSSVTMKLDNEPLLLPPGFLTPFTVTLQPPPAGA
jgi:hypothetical protein